jgi:D-alanyl-D-alanine carboxypeptidase/D-alanyl-D-alanine-endopeptidase (penicillin-binding protein 4)
MGLVSRVWDAAAHRPGRWAGWRSPLPRRSPPRRSPPRRSPPRRSPPRRSPPRRRAAAPPRRRAPEHPRDFRRPAGFPVHVSGGPVHARAGASPRRIAAALVCLLLLLPTAAPAASLEATKRALAQQMRWAGGGSGALAVELDTGAQIYARRPAVPRMPASVEKLYTTATALRALGAEGRLVTQVAALAGPDLAGTVPGDLYLRGSGDPTLGPVDLGLLADQLESLGVFGVAGRVVGDESAFDALRGPPSSGFRTSAYVGPLSALAMNHGLTGVRSPYFQAQPARFAARAFTSVLRRRGIWVGAPAATGPTPPGATPIATSPSPPVVELTRLMNLPSDNFAAETLLKAIGSQVTGIGSTEAGASVMRAELAELGIAPTVVDGSGLSRLNRTSPQQVVDLLRGMAGEVAFRGSLAVVGRSGTLSTRMRGTAAQDRCAAKTGTLTDVSALAGYCTTIDGTDVAFAFLMNGVNPSGARALQDRMTAALARYTP